MPNETDKPGDARWDEKKSRSNEEGKKIRVKPARHKLQTS